MTEPTQESQDTGKRAVIQRIVSDFSLAFAYMVSAMPTGALAVVLASTPVWAIARDYVKNNHHGRDRASWRVMTARRATRANETGDDVRSKVWFHRGNNTRTARVAAAPIDSVLFRGYPAALIVGRPDREFTDEELRDLHARAAQLGTEETAEFSFGSSFVAMDDSGKFLSSDASSETLADARDQLLKLAAELRAENAPIAARDRWPIRQKDGTFTYFRAVRYAEYPALSEGPVTFLARYPSPTEWRTLTADALAPDSELARLIPAISMILNDFARQPSLNELAEAVHLSPFHFHRRFCECTGTTPKHLLLDCQIELAQRELRDGTASMQQIAAACGFSHQSHFTSRFKQATGMTPSQWQKLARADVV